MNVFATASVLPGAAYQFRFNRVMTCARATIKSFHTFFDTMRGDKGVRTIRLTNRHGITFSPKNESTYEGDSTMARDMRDESIQALDNRTNHLSTFPRTQQVSLPPQEYLHSHSDRPSFSRFNDSSCDDLWRKCHTKDFLDYERFFISFSIIS